MQKSLLPLVMLIGAFFLFIYVGKNYNRINEQETNQCLMTWMVPVYVPLVMDDSHKFENKWRIYEREVKAFLNENSNLVHIQDAEKVSVHGSQQTGKVEATKTQNAAESSPPTAVHDEKNAAEASMPSIQATPTTTTPSAEEPLRSTSSRSKRRYRFNRNAYTLNIKSHWKKQSFYEFFLYRESKNYTLELKGVPVLFLHGNSGSYQQARSIGSGVHLNENLALPFIDPHIEDLKERFGWFKSADEADLLDIFTLDFKEELSGLHSEIIERQALYVNDAIDFILNSLYRNTKHQSVIIIAHSMGGIVARMVPMMINYTPGSVNTIFTLATPHIGHPFFVEKSMLSIASTINHYWTSNINNKDSDISNIVVVSVASGFRDSMIRDDMTRLDEFMPDTHQISVSSYEIPGVRVACDHVSIVWCKQMIHVLSLAILKLVTHKDNTDYLYTLDHAKRMQILRHTFLGSRPTAIVNRLVKTIPAYDPHDVLENEAIATHDMFNNVTAQLITIHSGSYVLDEDSFENNPDHMFALDTDSILKTGHNFLSLYCNVRFMDYQVVGDLMMGRDIHKFFDLKEYSEILPHVLKRERHMEIEKYPPSVAKSLYHLPIKTLRNQYGYQRIFMKFSKKLENPRCVFSLSNSELGVEESPVTFWDAPTSWFSGLPFYTIGKYDSSTQRIHLPNLARHIPYVFRITPNRLPSNPLEDTATCGLQPSLYYVGASVEGARVQERWQSNKDSFPVRFSSSASDEHGFYLIIESDPCWEGFSLEFRIAVEDLIPLTIYYQKNRMGTMMLGWIILILSIQSRLKFADSFSSLVTNPQLCLGILLPSMVIFSMVIPKIEMVLTYFHPDPLQANILFPTWLHQTSPIYIATAILLSWIMYAGTTFAFDVLFLILYVVSILPSAVMKRVTTSPQKFINPLFKAVVVCATLLLFKIHAGVSLYIVLLGQLAYCVLQQPNNAQKAYIILTFILCALSSPGAVLWLLEVKNHLSRYSYSLEGLLNSLPVLSFVNQQWYFVIPFYITLFINFTEEQEIFSYAGPLFIASLFTFVFSSTLYLVKVFISFAMLVSVARSFVRSYFAEKSVTVIETKSCEWNSVEVKMKGE